MLYCAVLCYVMFCYAISHPPRKKVIAVDVAVAPASSDLDVSVTSKEQNNNTKGFLQLQTGFGKSIVKQCSSPQDGDTRLRSPIAPITILELQLHG